MRKYQVALDVLAVEGELKNFIKAKDIKTVPDFSMKTSFVGTREVLEEMILVFFAKNDADRARSLNAYIMEA
ncbi:hypothetical protein fHeYen902_181 [Yersinia phage fHe-Yen9-02]|nr:hypothetical protein fHeYen902_181 [Yersinia phage fHe-Yen9-02]